jgi:HlyD family secretion protein
MAKKWVIALATALLVAVPVALHLSRAKELKEVEVAPAELRAIAPSILASGTLVYQSQVTLVSEILGRVDQVLVNEGETVAKGQLLLRLNSESSQAELAQLRAGRDQSQLNIERQRVNLDAMGVKIRRFEELRRQGFIEATRYEDLTTQRDLAEVELRASQEGAKQATAQLAQSQQRMSKNEIRAPINGRVTQMSIKSGETVVPSAMSIAGGSLMVISDTSEMYAEINVDEMDIARVQIGQAAQIVPAAFPDRSLRGVVERIAIAPKVNAGQSRSYPVRIHLSPSAEPSFHPGMSARAEIATASGNAKRVGVPVQAVQYEAAARKGDKSRASVFVIREGRAIKREVDTGLADDSHIEVLKGLKAGEVIVVGPSKTLRFLRDGEAIKAKEGSEESARVSAGSHAVSAGNQLAHA